MKTTGGKLPAIDRALHPHLIARFRADIAALWPEGERLALAISGGPDSLALLLLAHEARPGMIEAATVDHGLRSEAADEAQLVAQICQALGVPHQVLRVDVAEGNVQSMARNARYGALTKWMEQHELCILATAHHADDQAETLLMRLNRASGLSGLAGVRRQSAIPGDQHSGTQSLIRPLIRPLLGWRKADLIALVVDAGITSVQDPSNCDDAFDRVRIRKALAKADWLDSEAIAQSAVHLADADEALEWAASREWEECVQVYPDQIVYTPVAPRAVRLKVLARAIDQLGSQPRGGGVARLLDALEAGQGGNIGGVMATIADAAANKWTLQPEPRRRQSS